MGKSYVVSLDVRAQNLARVADEGAGNAYADAYDLRVLLLDLLLNLQPRSLRA